MPLTGTAAGGAAYHDRLGRSPWQVTVPADIVRSKYISLTTFRKDGGGVATPVWHAAKGDELFVVSDAGAWKVKRVRNNSDVVVTEGRRTWTVGTTTGPSEQWPLTSCGHVASARRPRANGYSDIDLRRP